MGFEGCSFAYFDVTFRYFSFFKASSIPKVSGCELFIDNGLPGIVQIEAMEQKAWVLENLVRVSFV